MKQQSKICAYCGGDFIPERRNGKYCSPTCRQYGYLKRKTGEAPHDRVKEKETVNQELSVMPPLVLEETVEQAAVVAIPKEKLSITSPDKNKPALMTIKKTYWDLLEQEKNYLNENLVDWWFSNVANMKEEKRKLVNENTKAKILIEIFLRFDQMIIHRTHIERFLVRMKEFEKDPSQGSDFYQSIWMIGDMGAMAKEFLKTIPETDFPHRVFNLTMEQRAKFEVMLKFMNEFNVRSPDFWLMR